MEYAFYYVETQDYYSTIVKQLKSCIWQNCALTEESANLCMSAPRISSSHFLMRPKNIMALVAAS